MRQTSSVSLKSQKFENNNNKNNNNKKKHVMGRSRQATKVPFQDRLTDPFVVDQKLHF